MSFLHRVVNFFLPGVCPICGSRMDFTDVLCEDCTSRLNLTPLMRLNIELKNVDSVWCYGKYEDELRDAIKLYKYGFLSSLHLIFVDRMVELFERSSVNFEGFTMTSVPPTLNSRLSKGFDHTGIVARKVAKRLGIDYKVLLKAKNGKPQVGLSAKERRRNVVGRYRIGNRVVPEKILIFDDVITTGSTLDECGRILKEHGAVEIHGFVLAHSII